MQKEQNDTNKVTSDEDSCKKNRVDGDIKGTILPSIKKWRCGWLFWTAALVFVLLLIVRFTNTSDPVERGPSVPPVSVPGGTPSDDEVINRKDKRRQELERQKLELEKKILLADVENRIQKYRGDVANTIERYRKMLPLSEAETHFKRSEDGASFIASREGLCGFKCCVGLAYKMAYDQVKKTTRTEDAISPIVKEKVVDEIERAVGVYAKWMADVVCKELAT